MVVKKCGMSVNVLIFKILYVWFWIVVMFMFFVEEFYVKVCLLEEEN